MQLKNGVPTQIQPGDFLSIQFKPDLVLISIVRSPTEALYFDNGDDKMTVGRINLAELIGNIAGLKVVAKSAANEKIIYEFQKG